MAKCSGGGGDPCEAELGPGTGRRPVISQVTLVWFPSNTSSVPPPHPHPGCPFLILILQRRTLSAPPSGALVLCCTQPMSFLVRVGTWWYILVAVGTI